MKKLTYKQALSNPSGKWSAHVSSRQIVKENLNVRFSSLMQRKNSFKLKVYKKGQNYVFHIKVPSEQEKYDIYYDVIIEIIKPNDDKLLTINNYEILFWSNSPAFTFTYAYVINQNGWLPTWVKPLCSKRSLTDPPSKRNPLEGMGFEKSIYFSLLYIKELHLNFESRLIDNVEKFSKSKLKLMSSSKKLKDYFKMKNDIKRNKKLKELHHKKTPTQTDIKEPNKLKSFSKIKKISKIKKTSKIKSIKKSK